MPTQARYRDILTADTLLFYSVVALVALAPLPLASNNPLSAAIMAVIAGTLLILWSLRLAISGHGLKVSPRLVAVPLALFALVCIWIFIQWVPNIPQIFSDPAWHMASKTLKEPLAWRISVNPNETLTGLMHLLTYATTFWLSLQLNNDISRAQRSVLMVAGIGCVYSLYGIVVYVTGNHWLLFYRKWAYADSLTSTFVNRNSFATFAGLCLLCATSMFILRIRRLLRNSRPLREASVILIENVIVHSRLLTISVLSIAIALVLTGSRAGVSLSFGALLLLILLPTDQHSLSMKKTLAVACSVLLVMIIALVTGGNLLSLRSGSEFLFSSFAIRSDIHRAVWEAIKSSPLTGTGFGTFPDVFTAYKSDRMGLTLFWDKAHNTYLENALELGIPAALCLVISITLLFLRCIRGVIQRRRDRIYPAIGVAATTLVGLHSWVDFSLQMPAVSILYAFLMGIAVSQSWSSINKDS